MSQNVTLIYKVKGPRGICDLDNMIVLIGEVLKDCQKLTTNALQQLSRTGHGHYRRRQGTNKRTNAYTDILLLRKDKKI